MLPVHICVIISFTGSMTFGIFLKNLSRKVKKLTGLADERRNSQIFHSSWVWWKFWKCNLKRRNQKTRRGNVRTAKMLRGRGTACYIWMLRSCITMHRNLVVFPYYQCTSAAKKHMLKEHSNLNQSSVAQGSAPAVRLLGVQQCRCLSLSHRNNPTSQPRWLQP